MADCAEAFRDFPLFRHLDREQVERFVAGCREVHLEADAVFIDQGEGGDQIYFVARGDMQVFVRDEDGHEHELALLTAPAVVGEMEFLTRDSRAACVRARTPVHGLAVDFDDFFHRLQAGDPASLRVFFHISQILARRLAAMNQKFAELDQRDPGARFDEMREFQQKLMTDWTF
jgi:CRP-like cAMP-binding protein